MDRRFFRRDANLQPPAGMIIAEFTSGTDALHFARAKGPRYTVTPGINHVYAVRVSEDADTRKDSVRQACDTPYDVLASSAASPSADSARPAPTVEETGRRFSLHAMTPRGAALLPELQKLLSRLPHGDSL